MSESVMYSWVNPGNSVIFAISLRVASESWLNSMFYNDSICRLWFSVMGLRLSVNILALLVLILDLGISLGAGWKGGVAFGLYW